MKQEYINEKNVTNRNFRLVLKLNPKMEGIREVLKQDILDITILQAQNLWLLCNFCYAMYRC